MTMRIPAAIAALFLLSACNGGSGTGGAGSLPANATRPAFGSLATLNTVTTIGSTIDPGPAPGGGDSNPYGLAIAPVTSGLMTAGDLIICNFNDKANVQGNGTTIEDLNPAPGSRPVRLAQSPQLAGCNALAISGNGNIWAADYTANNNPIITPAGAIRTTLSQNTWAGPWGQAFNGGYAGKGAFFETNANNGTVVRINTTGGFTFDTILSGLTHSGVPGSLLAPAGLTYDGLTDTLYVVDSNANRVLTITQATTAPANQYAVLGTAFNTPNVTVLYTGKPLNAPISSALLANGNLVVGNTGDNNLVEIAPNGVIVDTKTVDTGAAGAIFGIVATSAFGPQYIYFNDDNTNSVVRVSP